MALQEYKCPCCAGAIEFNAYAQKLKCPYCETEFEISALQQYYQDVETDGNDDMNWETQQDTWRPGETDGMRVYTCQSCGGEIIADETTGATHCPYCDNPVVMSGQFSGAMRPEYVIPFKLDKEAAKKGLRDHLLNKKFLPRVFKDDNHINEVKGVYVPFWLFDSDAEGGARYRATRRHSHTEGNYRVTETEHFHVYREGRIRFENVSIDGSSKMPDDLMESIEPFNFAEAVPFQTAYLAGYLADKYDVTSDQTMERANTRVRKSIDEQFRSTVTGYDSVTSEGSNIRLQNAKAKYALYPVWVLTTSWNGQNYLFGMNGQTGKFVGNLPCDKTLYRNAFLKVFAIAAVIVYGLGWLFGRG